MMLMISLQHVVLLTALCLLLAKKYLAIISLSLFLHPYEETCQY